MQLVYTIIISNNCSSFHLRWKKNLVKYQKVSKYYENDCSVLNNSAEVARKMLLYGDSKFSNNNSNILKASISYILNTDRFSDSVFCYYGLLIYRLVYFLILFWFDLQLWEYFFKSITNFLCAIPIGLVTPN